MAGAEAWPSGPPQPPWPAAELHLWWADLATVADGEDGLSADECAYAAQARVPGLRQRRQRTRRVLRDLLGRYLRLPLAAVPIAAAPGGKPRLPAGAGLGFNLSHCGDTVLMAFGAGGEVGVDLQHPDDLQDAAAVARTSFSVPEQAELQRLPVGERHAAVLRGWVRKEAYAKARGQGYRYGFAAFGVRLAAPAPAPLLLHDDHDPSAPRAWWLADVPMPPPWVAAGCVQGGPRPCRHWRWPPAHDPLPAPPGPSR